MLWKAEELGARSLALVAFGTGVGGFPLEEAAAIEVEEVRAHLASGSGLERVVFARARRGGAGRLRGALRGGVDLAGVQPASSPRPRAFNRGRPMVDAGGEMSDLLPFIAGAQKAMLAAWPAAAVVALVLVH